MTFTLSINPLVLKTVLIMLYLMVGVVIAVLRFINDANVSGIGAAFGWGGGMMPTWLYLLYILLWPLHFIFVIVLYFIEKRKGGR